MTLVTRRRSRVRAKAGLPRLEIDLHGYVLARLDAHLAALQRLRQELSRPGRLQPGARWQTAAATILAARDYAHDLAQALGTGPTDPAGVAPDE
jgi:hypothetical protein